MTMSARKLNNFNNDPLWEKVKEVVSQCRFGEANRLVGVIYRKYGEKYN